MSTSEESVELADRVRHALRRAGLPVLDRDEYNGAKVEAAVEAELPGGGVFVSWNPSLDLVDTVVERMESGTYDSPVVSASGRVRQEMQPALIGVLRAAGFNAEVHPDDIRVSQVHVLPGALPEAEARLNHPRAESV